MNDITNSHQNATVLFLNAPVFAAGALPGAVQVMQMTMVQFEGVYLNLLKMHRIRKLYYYFSGILTPTVSSLRAGAFLCKSRVSHEI